MAFLAKLFSGRGSTVVLSREEQQSPYLHSSRSEELLRLRPDGLPPIRLSRSGHEWHVVGERTRKIVSVGNRKLRPMGLWTVRVRGVDYHRAEAKAAELFVGSPLRLEHEPDNLHDSSAVAVEGLNRPGTIGYVNKQMASGLTKLLDTETISLRGSSAGDRQDGAVKVAGTPEVMAWNQRR